MRILYLMTEPFGFGGVQSDMLALGKAYSARGHYVAVATSTGERVAELEATGTEFIELDMRFWSPWRLFRLARQLRQIIDSREINIVAPQSVRTTLICWAALRLLSFGRKRSREPIITTIHNIHNPVHFRYAGRLLETCSDFVIFESNYERDRLLKSGLSPARSEVVHSGIDLDRFQPSVPDNTLREQYKIDANHLVFGIVARFSEEKGHDHLLRAFKRLVPGAPHARLLLIGDGPLENDIRALVAELDLEPLVVFTGAQRNIPEHLSIIDVFVLASTRESFPLSAREAMA
ncbi:MAG: glycosyltransferase, partial [Gammaproteobacteria bacterium]|nr:glycosyltransferase [Gammaproteobacteria bacterium]